MPSVGQAQLPSNLPNGDVIIGSDYELSTWPANPDLAGSTFYMDGNLTIRAGGVVTIKDGTLSFTQDTGLDRIAGTGDDHVYTLTIEDGGQLILQGAILTTHLNQLFDYPSLGVLIQNGGSLIATDSVLMFPGHILIDESSAVLTNTTITGHDAAAISTYCNSTVFPSDYFDDSADLLISSSDVKLIDSRVEKVFKLDSATSATADLFNHDYSFATDTADRDSVFYSIKRHPSQFGPLNTASGPLANMTADDQKYISVEPSQSLFIDTTALSGLAFPSSSSFAVFLNVKYHTGPSYTIGNYIQTGLQNGPLTNTVIRPSVTSTDVVGTANLGLMSSTNLADLNVSFINGNAAGSGREVLINEVWFNIVFSMNTYKNITAAFSSNVLAINSFLDVNFDNLSLAHHQLNVRDNSVAFLYGVYGNVAPETPNRLPAYEASGSSSIYVYRWLDFNVFDEEKFPVSGAYVNATLRLTGEPAYYYTEAGRSNVPSTDVLAYLGRTSTDYIRTNKSGSALIPLLSEILTTGGLQVLGPYSLEVKYYNSTGVEFINNSGVSWNVYPKITLDDQTATIDFTMAGLFLDVESDLIIGGETTFVFTGASFIHRGKIIVEDNGTLVINSASLNIDQDFDNEFGIYVHNNGRIVMSQATMSSSHKILLNLMDNGRLSMDNSTLLSTVSVSLDNKAQVFAWGSAIYYRLIAPITSNGTVYAYNTTFYTALTEFGGNARGYFTSVAMRSIRPLNNAIVWNYHWINVLVVDSHNKTLPNANVQLSRYDVGYPLYASKMTDATGHAIFQALSETIDSTILSPHFMGNYRLNATYLIDGRSFSTATNTSVSLTPYSEPLVRDDPSVSLIVTLSGIGLLSVGDGDVSLVPSSPTMNSSVIVSAVIHNNGDINADMVNVSFTDRLPGGQIVLIGYNVIPSITAGSTESATINWVPTISGTHTITVMIKRGGPNQSISSNNQTLSVVVKDNANLDLKFIGGIEVSTAGVPVNTAVIGQIIRIRVNVTCEGQMQATGVAILFSFIDSDHFTRDIGTQTVNFNPNQTRQIDLTYTVGVSGVTIGNYTIKVTADSNASISEINELNNFVTSSFEVNAPNLRIDTAIDQYQVKPDTDITISGQVINSITHNPISGVQVIVAIYSIQGVPVSGNFTTTTSSQGAFVRSVHVPVELSRGSYLLKVTAIIPGGIPIVQDSPQFEVTSQGSEIGIPLWIWVLVILIVLGFIIAFSLYLYKYGLGRMVECGECGSLIPEASKRCPKCGVEFESGTAKCSQCGAWIPATSKECPECGATFATEPMTGEENEYIKKMRSEYDEFVNPYREQAKGTLGKKYSEAKFAKWWMKQPSYVTFERWLSKEEETRKVAGTAFPCPVCGTLNPKGSDICHKCGTVFDAVKGAEGAPEGAVKEGEQKPLRRIVRRQAEKKLIPRREAKLEEEAPAQPEQSAEEESEEQKSP